MTCGIWSNRIKKNIGLCLVSVKLKSGEKVKVNKRNVGILVCGSGMGMAMAANKHKKIIKL